MDDKIKKYNGLGTVYASVACVLLTFFVSKDEPYSNIIVAISTVFLIAGIYYLNKAYKLAKNKK